MHALPRSNPFMAGVLREKLHRTLMSQPSALMAVKDAAAEFFDLFVRLPTRSMVWLIPDRKIMGANIAAGLGDYMTCGKGPLG